MARIPENPDRNFSANGHAEDNFENLRRALDQCEPALPFNEAARVRFGKIISHALLDTKPQSQQKS